MSWKIMQAAGGKGPFELRDQWTHKGFSDQNVLFKQLKLINKECFKKSVCPHLKKIKKESYYLVHFVIDYFISSYRYNLRSSPSKISSIVKSPFHIEKREQL